LWIAIVFPHMVFMFFYNFFQNYLCQFYFFNIELVENFNCSFPHKILWIAIVFPYMGLFLSFFFLWFLFFYMIFFQNYFYCFYFFNIKLVENLTLYFFFFKALWIATVIPHTVFLLWIFLKLSLSILFF